MAAVCVLTFQPAESREEEQEAEHVGGGQSPDRKLEDTVGHL